MAERESEKVDKTPLPGELRRYAAPLPEWFDRALENLGGSYGLTFEVDEEFSADGRYCGLMLEPTQETGVYCTLTLTMKTVQLSPFDDERFCERRVPAAEQWMRNKPISGGCSFSPTIYPEGVMKSCQIVFEGRWRNCSEFLEDVFHVLFNGLMPYCDNRTKVRAWWAGCETIPKSIENLGLA